MATPPPTALAHLGFDAMVMCEGEPLPIYNIERVGNKATGWIASEVGKAFSVQTRIIEDSQRIIAAARLYVDGTKVAGKIIGNTHPYTDRRQVIIDGPYTSKTTVKTLLFSNLAMSDDDSAIRDSQLIEALGVLNVKVVRVTVENGATFVPAPTPTLQTNQTVHERAKKLGGHRAMLGSSERVSMPNIVSTTDIELHVEFEFRYRPKELLQALDIIPVPRAEPAKRPRESGLNDSTNRPCAKKPKVVTSGKDTAEGIKQPKPELVDEDGVEAMRARIRKLEARLRERDGKVTDDEDADEQIPIKREPELINAGRFFAKGEVIDLTDD